MQPAVWIFPFTGFEDGRELFSSLVALSTPAETVCGGSVLLAVDKTIWGGTLETGGWMGIFPSGITRLSVAGPDGTTVCVETKLLYKLVGQTRIWGFLTTQWPGERKQIWLGNARADHPNFGEFSPGCNSARSFLGLMKARTVKLRIQSGNVRKTTRGQPVSILWT